MKTVIHRNACPRRPVQRYPRFALRDVQAAPPAGWCNRCGKEIYVWPPEEICDRCKKEEQRCRI